jgi:hypothetical protein
MRTTETVRAWELTAKASLGNITPTEKAELKALQGQCEVAHQAPGADETDKDRCSQCAVYLG